MSKVSIDYLLKINYFQNIQNNTRYNDDLNFVLSVQWINLPGNSKPKLCKISKYLPSAANGLHWRLDSCKRKTFKTKKFLEFIFKIFFKYLLPLLRWLWAAWPKCNSFYRITLMSDWCKIDISSISIQICHLYIILHDLLEHHLRFFNLAQIQQIWKRNVYTSNKKKKYNRKLDRRVKIVPYHYSVYYVEYFVTAIFSFIAKKFICSRYQHVFSNVIYKYIKKLADPKQAPHNILQH